MSDLAPKKRRGPGRPRNIPAAPTAAEAALANAVATAQAARAEAQAAYLKAPTVATETALLVAELSVASALAAYCQAHDDHSHALKYGELAVKFAGRIAPLREVAAFDRVSKLDQLIEARAKRHDALGKRGKR
jgi:hypothetical protein